MPDDLPPFEKECFFITPIGKEGSDERRRADGVLKAIVEPAAEESELQVVRADQINEGGQVNLQIIEHVCKAATTVADLTGGNLNVYYEVGMRHTTRLPLVLIADESETLPFDLLQQRTVFFTNDLAGAATCREQVADYLRRALEGVVDSPVDAAVNLRHLQQGDETQRAVAELVSKVEDLSEVINTRVGRSAPVPLGATRALVRGWGALADLASEEDNDALDEIVDRLARPVSFIALRDPRLGGRYKQDSGEAAAFEALRQTRSGWSGARRQQTLPGTAPDGETSDEAAREQQAETADGDE